MEICAPNLISFTYFGPQNVFYEVENFPPLVNLSIRFYTFLAGDLNRLCSVLPHLETLTLESDPLLMRVVYAPVPILLKLTKLVLRVDHRRFPCFHVLIHLAPYLRELILEFNEPGIYLPHIFPRQRDGGVRVHECLKVIKVKGFFGHWIDIEYVTRALQNCGVSLEKLIIDPYMPPPRVTCGLVNRYVTIKHEVHEPHEIIKVRNDAKQLKPKLPAGAELVIL